MVCRSVPKVVFEYLAVSRIAIPPTFELGREDYKKLNSRRSSADAMLIGQKRYDFNGTI